MATPDQLHKLEAELESVRIEFERYFLGLEKRLPMRARADMERKVRAFIPSDDAVSRFKHRNLLQRLQTMCRYWDRVQRAIEAGTYHRDVARADYRASQVKPATTDVGMRGASKRGTDTERKAAEVGAEAAAFIQSLTSGPKVGMRGTGRKSEGQRRAGDCGFEKNHVSTMAKDGSAQSSKRAPLMPPRNDDEARADQQKKLPKLTLRGRSKKDSKGKP